MGKSFWEPKFKEQEDFLSLPDTIFEGCFGGAAGGGKTETCIALPVARGFHLEPRFQGVYFRRTNKQIEESLEPRAKVLYRNIPGTDYNHTTKTFRFPSGAQMRLSYLENMDHARQHDTNEYNLALWEELTHFEEQVYKYVTFSRVRTSSNLPAISRSAATPGNIGHSWVFERFIEPEEKGYKIIQETIKDPVTGKEKKVKRIFIPSLGMNNPMLLVNDPDYFVRLMMMDEAEQRAKIYGDWRAFTGQVFREFRSHHLRNEPENAVHIVPEILIPDFWPKIIAIDWGYRHPTFVLWGAVDPFGRVYIYREYVAYETKISEWSADILRLSQFDENIVDIVIDPSSMQNRGQDQTIFEQFVTQTGWSQTRLADNDRIGGKSLVHEFLRWNQRPKRFEPQQGFDLDRANFILRGSGAEAYKRYVAIFSKEPDEEFIPRLQIFNTCKGLAKVIPQCSYDDKKVEDVKKFDGDDGYDCLRYLLKAVDLHINPQKYEYAKRLKISNVVLELESSQKTSADWTRFYRKMEFLEAQTKEQGAVVRAPNRWLN